jgi:hypothetical protein
MPGPLGVRTSVPWAKAANDADSKAEIPATNVISIRKAARDTAASQTYLLAMAATLRRPIPRVVRREPTLHL